jgi:hypothetical protein
MADDFVSMRPSAQTSKKNTNKEDVEKLNIRPKEGT